MTYVDGSAQPTIEGDAAAAPAVDTTMGKLHWEDTLAPGQTATITYQVTVNQDANDADKIVNVVAGGGDVPPGVPPVVPNCVPDTASQTADCTTEHVPSPPAPVTPTPVEPTTPATPAEPTGTEGSRLARTGTDTGAAGLALIAGLVAAAGLGLTGAARRRNEKAGARD